jgi:hypothetical protein
VAIKLPSYEGKPVVEDAMITDVPYGIVLVGPILRLKESCSLPTNIVPQSRII